MQGDEEVSIATNALELKIKNLSNLKSLLVNLSVYHLLITLDWGSCKQKVSPESEFTSSVSEHFLGNP